MSFDSGTLLGLKGFAAAMLGGLGSPYGALAGGLLLGVAEAAVAGYGAPAYADAVAFVVLLVVLFRGPPGSSARRRWRVSDGRRSPSPGSGARPAQARGPPAVPVVTAVLLVPRRCSWHGLRAEHRVCASASG